MFTCTMYLYTRVYIAHSRVDMSPTTVRLHTQDSIGYYMYAPANTHKHSLQRDVPVGATFMYLSLPSLGEWPARSRDYKTTPYYRFTRSRSLLLRVLPRTTWGQVWGLPLSWRRSLVQACRHLHPLSFPLLPRTT